MAYERRFWVFERIGWLTMAVVVVLALMGFFGEGPVSRSNAGGVGQGLILEYERIARRNAPQALLFQVTAPPDPDGKIRISIDRQFLQGVQIQTVTPEPETVQAGPAAHTYEFAAAGGDTTVSFKIKIEAIGWLAGTAAVEGRQPVDFRQFVYP